MKWNKKLIIMDLFEKFIKVITQIKQQLYLSVYDFREFSKVLTDQTLI